MDSNSEKLLFVCLVLGVLVIGSIVVYGTAIAYETEDTRSEGTTTFGAPAVYTVENEVMSEASAEQIARTVASGTVTSVELKKKKSDPDYIYYDFEFRSGNKESEVKVHAVTGKILDVEHESDDNVDSSTVKISRSKAEAAALKAVPGGSILSYELEREDGEAIYEFDVSYNGRTLEVEVDANSGEVLGIGFGSGSVPSGFASGGISRDEAIQIAEDRISSSFDFEEIGTGSYRGTSVWEVEFEDGNEEAEVIIDRDTGEVLKVEYEDEDDDDD